MAATNDRTVTGFGGTGFLGRRVVRHLLAHEFAVLIASRDPACLAYNLYARHERPRHSTTLGGNERIVTADIAVRSPLNTTPRTRIARKLSMLPQDVFAQSRPVIRAPSARADSL